MMSMELFCCSAIMYVHFYLVGINLYNFNVHENVGLL